MTKHDETTKPDGSVIKCRICNAPYGNELCYYCKQAFAEGRRQKSNDIAKELKSLLKEIDESKDEGVLYNRVVDMIIVLKRKE